MKASGIDLEEYGRVEDELLSEHDWMTRLPDYGVWDCPPVRLRLVKFSYGAEVQNWSFDWEIDYGGIVAECWDLVENPPLDIVGAWVDE